MPPQQPQTQSVQGPKNRVPCPTCGKPNNFMRVDELLEVGNVFTCDHCKKPMQIAGVKNVTFVAVRKPGPGGAIQRRR
jgi:hypothetical protein